MNVKNYKVLEITGGKDEEGQNVGVGTKNVQQYQRWKIVYIDKKTKDITKGRNKNFGFFVNRPFYIMSRMPMHRVMELVGGRNLVIKRLARTRNTQKFVFDQTSKTIRSVAYKGRSFDIQNAGSSSNLQMWTTNSRWFQLFYLRGNNIVNTRGKYVDVQGGQDTENRNVIVWTKSGKVSQEWWIRYLDSMPREPRKGEINKEFGLYVERPFHIVTQLASRRYLDVLGRNLVIKTPNGR